MNVAFIAARCGSKSIKFKNIKAFCGKPLIYWNLLALENSKNIDQIYVATDCKKIAMVVNQFQFSKVKVFRRNKDNASDEASTESVMLEFLMKKNFNDDDIFTLVQITSPLSQAHDFDNAIEQFKRENVDSLLSCVREKKFIWKDDCQPFNYDFKNRPRRQDFNGVLIENGAFYISTIGGIKKSNNRLSGTISIYEMAEYNNIEIDEENDWNIAENLMKKYILNVN
jgi:CMP-N-acetylneuraminic acid synthetase